MIDIPNESSSSDTTAPELTLKLYPRTQKQIYIIRCFEKLDKMDVSQPGRKIMYEMYYLSNLFPARRDNIVPYLIIISSSVSFNKTILSYNEEAFQFFPCKIQDSTFLSSSRQDQTMINSICDRNNNELIFHYGIGHKHDTSFSSSCLSQS